MTNSHYTLLLYFLLLGVKLTAAVNITALLSPYPNLTVFSRLLSSTGVAGKLTSRSSLTILAVPDPFLLRSNALQSSDLADVIRLHVILRYLSLSDIPSSGVLVTTLLQTTSGHVGILNLTRDVTTGKLTAHSSNNNASILSQIQTLPPSNNISILSVDSLLLFGSDEALRSSDEAGPHAAAGVNLTQVLTDGKDFNVAVSMLEASGVVSEFEDSERGAGITVFVPTDEAFGDFPSTGDRLQSLPADQKAMVLRFHVLHSYYPLGSLESIVNPNQPALATEDTSASRFTLNMSRVNGSVLIDTGVVAAVITRTVFDQNPVAVFAVSRVLLPREIFGKEAKAMPPPMAMESAPPMAMESAPPLGSATPALEGEVTSSSLSGDFICIEIWLIMGLLFELCS